MELASVVSIAMGLLVAIVLLFIAPRAGASLRPYWERRCAGRAWRRAFPEAPHHEIRSFLRMFTDAFAFPREHALKFVPADRVRDIYEAANPAEGWPDALELETLERRLKSAYGIVLRDCWSPSLTLGELFARSHRPAA